MTRRRSQCRSILQAGLVVFGIAAAYSSCPCSAGEPVGKAPSLPKVRIGLGGRTFAAEDGKPFVPMGVNYYRPGTGWAPQLWKQFDAEATRKDFTRMKQLGVNCVRVFLTYGSFFMESDSLQADGLAKFDQLLGIAEEAGIYIHPTGPDHWEGLPPWAGRDRIADDRVLQALENFWKLFAQRYRARNVLFAYDLLNEPQVAWDTPAMRAKWNRWLESRYGSAEKMAQAWGVKPDDIRWGSQPPPAAKESRDVRQLLDYQHFREEVADEWTRRQSAAIKSADPQALVTVGMIQWSVPAVLPGVRQYAAFRPDRQAKLLDFLEIHFYPLASGFYDYTRPEDEERNLAYLESVVREVAAPGKPVVVAEFGWYGGGKLTINRGVHPAASEEQQARWCRRAVEATAGLATGWLNWGFYDHPEARDVSQLTGLLTVEGKPKAWAREFHSLTRSLAGKPIAPAKLGPRPALDWDRAITSPKASQQFHDEYLKAFKAHRGNGSAQQTSEVSKTSEVSVRIQLPKRPAPGVVLYVAPGGADTSPGTQERPFATLKRARDEIRSLKTRGGLPKGGVTVYVRGGEYKVAQTFQLGAEDSGTETSPVVYRGFEGETPRFSGGIRLSGFQPVRDPALLARLPEEARGKVVQVDLKAHGLTSLKPLRLGGFASGLGFKTHPAMELFFNGQALQLARWPNDGYVRVAEVAAGDGHQIHGLAGTKTGRFTYEGDRPRRWKDEKEALLYGYWFFDWADSYERVASIDAGKREITLEPPYHTYGYRKGQRYYAINLLSEIDVPGEWYLDRGTGILYLYPPSDPDKAVVELSTVEVPFVTMQGVSHVTLQGFLWELGCGDVVIIRDGGNCLLAGCTIRRCGGNGVELQGGAGHGVLSCDIYSMGRGGTGVSGGDRKTLAPARHFIENCHIFGLSRIDHTYTPAVRMTGAGNRIAHNLVHDVRSSAINLTGNDHLVELNEVFGVVWESDDQGGADMFGNPTYRGNVYRYNYWHHIGNWQDPGAGPGCGQAGIRLDDAICGTLVYGNVFYRSSAGRLGFGGVQIHGGKDNIVDNNVFVDCMAAVSFSPWGDARWRQFTGKSLQSPEIDKSLYLARYPELARLSEDHDVNTVSRNLVVRCGKFLHRDSGRTRVADNLVTSEDPGFADAARGVFRLKENSPAIKQIGLRPIPFDEIGLYRDEFRKELPAETVRQGRATGSAGK